MFEASDVMELFPSCLWLNKVSDSCEINEGLMRGVEEMRVAGEGNTRSSGKGWMSPTNLLEYDAFLPLSEYIIAAAEQALGLLRYKFDHFYISECWANMNGTGEIHPRHSHPNCFLSGVYYVQTPKGCGDIVFYDPRAQAAVLSPQFEEFTLQNSDRHYLQPDEGMLIMFPSWLEHSVAENKSGADRLSISFNIMLTGTIGYESAQVTI